jgi:hypothetical protein
VSDWPRDQFQQWLKAKVLENQNLARVCCVAVHQGRTEEVAAKMGLHAALVDNIGREYARRVVAAGRPLPTGKKVNERSYPQFKVGLPEEVWVAWNALADRIHMKPTTAVRALIHEYLLSPEDPVRADPRWIVAGHFVTGPTAHEYKAAITQGALAAFNTRAARLGLGSVGLLRALMAEALAGRRRIRLPITRAAMFEDVKRYVT